MALQNRVWGVGKILVLLTALVATFLIFATAGMRLALRAREVRVPNLAGRGVDEATRFANSAALTLRVDENRRIDPSVPEGRIVAQDPPAGAMARQQRTVRVWLSGGVRAATIPALVGETERTARIRIEQAGLTLKSIAEARLPNVPADAVVAQAPPPSTNGEAVSLLVNRGEAPISYVMPDVVGVDAQRAADAFRARAFNVTIAGQPQGQTVGGTVIRQQPSAGSRVALTDPISLEVSR